MPSICPALAEVATLSGPAQMSHPRGWRKGTFSIVVAARGERSSRGVKHATTSLEYAKQRQCELQTVP